MKISIFGIGYVGAVSAAILAREGHDVIAVDVHPDKVAALNAGRSPVIESGLGDLVQQGFSSGRLRATLACAEAVEASTLSFVCVGTPSLPNGNLDLSQVVKVSREIGVAIARKRGFHGVVVRSTMLPGSLERSVIPAIEAASGKRAGEGFGIAYYPEFLREGTAIEDHYGTQPVVVGVHDARTADLLREITGKLAGSRREVDVPTAEMVKYANNAWHAAKIVFANEIGTICKSAELDSFSVMSILCADTKLNTSSAYLRPGFAFGGSCLPKDLRALRQRAKQADLSVPMLDSLLTSNATQVERAFHMVERGGGRRVGLLGLTFKSDTDDLRESPAVELAERLVGKGYLLRIFDPNLHLSRLIGANRSFIDQHLPHLAGLLVGSGEAAVTDADTVVVAQAIPPILAALRSARETQAIVDLAHIPEEFRVGRYEGIAW